MPEQKYEVIVKTNPVDAPKEHEMSAALILAYHFRANVIFLRPERKKTPDIEVDGIRWEVKSPKGDGKKTIENNLRTARKQSSYIVIDLSRSKMHSTRVISRANFYLRTEAHNIKRLKIITKTEKIIDLLVDSKTKPHSQLARQNVTLHTYLHGETDPT